MSEYGIKEIVSAGIEKMNPETLTKLTENVKETKSFVNLDRTRKNIEYGLKSGFSKKIVERVRSIGELKIYKEAALKENKETNALENSLVENNLDNVLPACPYVDGDSRHWEKGETNRARMHEHKSPVIFNEKTNQYEKVELHHVGQNSDSPFAELLTSDHRGPGNDKILHPEGNQHESEIDRNKFGVEKANYWEARIDGIEKNE